MKPLRIAHISDTHLGYRALPISDPRTGRNQRSVDIERAFGWVIDDILQRGVDLVIHSGDLFHHTRPAFPAIGAAIRQLRKLERAEIPTFVIAGNHDTPGLRTTGSVFWVLESAMPVVTFCAGYEEQQELVESFDAVITLIPHGRLTDPDPPSVFPVQAKRNILVTHGLVPNMNLPFVAHEPGEEEISESMLDTEFDYIALGHYHQFSQPRPNAWYAGSTERIGWGDVAYEPGYNIVELGEPGTAPVVERVSIPMIRPMYDYIVPERITIDQDGVRIAEHVLSWMDDLKSPDAMTRILLRDASRPVRRHAESLIRQDAGAYVWSTQVVGRSSTAVALDERNPELPALRLLDQFAAFVTAEQEAGNFDPLFAVNFAITGRRELENAQRVLEAQLTSEDA